MMNLVRAVLAILVATSVGLIVFKVEVVKNVNAGAILLALVVVYLIFSFNTVKTNEVAMVEVFGKPIKILSPGLCFIPAGISQIFRESANLFQDELPADPEKIFRNDDKEKVPTGMFPPIRIKFGSEIEGDQEVSKDDPYNIPMVAEVVPVISWKITNMMVFRKVFGETSKVRQILSDRVVGVCSEDFSKVTPAKALINLKNTSQKLEDEFKKTIEKLEGNGGIELSGAYIKQILFSHDLNKAVTEVKEAEQRAKAVVHQADGEAKAVVLKANAEKERLVKTGLAKVDSNGNITELVPDADTRVKTEALRELAKVQGTLVLGDTSTMLGINNSKKGN